MIEYRHAIDASFIYASRNLASKKKNLQWSRWPIIDLRIVMWSEYMPPYHCFFCFPTCHVHSTFWYSDDFQAKYASLAACIYMLNGQLGLERILLIPSINKRDPRGVCVNLKFEIFWHIGQWGPKISVAWVDLCNHQGTQNFPGFQCERCFTQWLGRKLTLPISSPIVG